MVYIKNCYEDLRNKKSHKYREEGNCSIFHAVTTLNDVRFTLENVKIFSA